MTALKIVARCESGHEQTIVCSGQTLHEVETFAGLLDGSSPLYVHPPGAESVIGKCGIYGERIACTVTTEAP
jgi:hypothetical protein